MRMGRKPHQSFEQLVGFPAIAAASISGGEAPGIDPGTCSALLGRYFDMSRDTSFSKRV